MIIGIIILAVAAVLCSIKLYARYKKRQHLKRMYKQAEYLMGTHGKELSLDMKKGIKQMLSDSVKN